MSSQMPIEIMISIIMQAFHENMEHFGSACRAKKTGGFFKCLFTNSLFSKKTSL